MSYSKKQLVDRALRVANLTATDPNVSAVIDNRVVLEDLLYTAMKQAVIEASQNPAEVGSLKRDFTVTITSGVGTLPDDSLDEFLDDSNIYSTTDDDISQLTSFQPRYLDYIRPTHSQLGYYTVQGTSLLFKEPGGDAGDFTGDIHFVCTSMPDLSGAFTAAITIPTPTAERTIVRLAELLKGAVIN